MPNQPNSRMATKTLAKPLRRSAPASSSLRLICGTTDRMNPPRIAAIPQAITLSAAGGSYFALSGVDGLTLTADARSEIYHRFHGLNVLGLGGTALYRHKFGLGYAAPWILVAASASHDNYRDDIRDSDRIELRAELGKRFTESFDAAFGGRLERRYGKNDAPVVPGISGKVFDLRGRSAYARAGYAVSDQLLLGVELAVRRGDVVATTRPDFEIFVVSDAIACRTFVETCSFGNMSSQQFGTPWSSVQPWLRSPVVWCHTKVKLLSPFTTKW